MLVKSGVVTEASTTAPGFSNCLPLGKNVFKIYVYLTLLIVYNYIDYELEEEWLSIVCPVYITGTPPSPRWYLQIKSYVKCKIYVPRQF